MAISDPPILFEDLPQHLVRMSAAIEQADWSELWREELREIVLEGQAENFANATDPEGNEWPLRKYHGHPVLDRGRSGVPGHPLLIDLGDLLESVLMGADENHIESATQNEFTTGTSIFYAAYHEFGVPERNLPARSFIGISEETIEKLASSVANRAAALIAGV